MRPHTGVLVALGACLIKLCRRKCAVKGVCGGEPAHDATVMMPPLWNGPTPWPMTVGAGTWHFASIIFRFPALPRSVSGGNIFSCF